MASLSHYYGSARSAFGSINPDDAWKLGEEWGIGAIAAAGAVGIAAAVGGMDKKVFGMPVPVDGAMAVGLGLFALSSKSKELRVASIALGGSAAVRTFSKLFGAKLGLHGEIDDWTSSGYSGMGFGFGNAATQFSPGYGWGQDLSHDRLVEAAKYL